MATLKSYIDRIENLLDQRKDINGDIKDVYDEAASDGFDKKIMRKVVKLNQMNPTDRMQEEETIDTYMRELERANV